jgi:hypothetical protein
MLTAERLREVLDYNSETGAFTWIIQTARKQTKIGDVAGGLHKSTGYWQICIDYHVYRAHRLAWLYMTGAWPMNQIDHINFNRIDNRFDNLREATNSQNQGNRGIQKNNTSGFKGVRWNISAKKWRSQIYINNKHIYLGGFDSINDAVTAYERAARGHFGKFMRMP